MKIEELEGLRKKASKLIIMSYIGFAIGFILAALLASYSTVFSFLGVIIIIVSAVCIIVGLTQFNKIKKSFKNNFLPDMVKELFDNAVYNPKAGLKKELVYSANLLKKADRYHSEDYIAGTIDDVNFVSSDIKLEEEHTQVDKNGTRTYYVTYFLGRFFEFDFNKQFKGKVIVTEGSLPTFFSKYKRIELESIDFNKKFKTYTLEEHDAFYVITPQLMEAIMNLEKHNPGTLAFSFAGTKLHIAINNNRDTFELQLFKPINDVEIANMRRDLYAIVEIVKELKLNDKIFM